MDLEEIVHSQSVRNNEITETEFTLVNRNSRVTEAEERLSELEDRMLAINEADRAGGGGWKEMTTTSGTILNAPHLNHRFAGERRQKESA